MHETVGGEHNACPWRAYTDPVCVDVLDACKWFESGQLHLVFGHDPPAYLVQGVGVYQSALNMARADIAERERAERKNG